MKAAVLTDTHYFFSQLSNMENEAMLQSIAGAEKPDLFLHCGDIGNHELWHTEEYWKYFRRVFPGVPVGAVLGNHNFWEWKQQPKHHGVQEMIDANREIFREYEITYLPDGPLVLGDISVSGFNGWYHDIYVNKENLIPHFGDPADGRVKLSRLANEGFARVLTEMEAAKKDGKKTVLVTHFGSIAAASEQDWKSRKLGGYFGANPAWEDHLGNCDWYLFGHSHFGWEGLAKNGTTKVLNTGSDYEAPRYKIIEI